MHVRRRRTPNATSTVQVKHPQPGSRTIDVVKCSDGRGEVPVHLGPRLTFPRPKLGREYRQLTSSSYRISLAVPLIHRDPSGKKNRAP